MPGVRCDLSSVDNQFRTPLHWASVLGLTEIVGLLMERGANSSATDTLGATPLHYAVSMSLNDCMVTLICLYFVCL